VPSPYRVVFARGLARGAGQGHGERNALHLAPLRGRAGPRLSDLGTALGLGARERVRLRVTLDAEDAASLYRSLPPDVGLVVVACPRAEGAAGGASRRPSPGSPRAAGGRRPRPASCTERRHERVEHGRVRAIAPPPGSPTWYQPASCDTSTRSSWSRRRDRRPPRRGRRGSSAPPRRARSRCPAARPGARREVPLVLGVTHTYASGETPSRARTETISSAAAPSPCERPGSGRSRGGRAPPLDELAVDGGSGPGSTPIFTKPGRMPVPRCRPGIPPSTAPPAAGRSRRTRASAPRCHSRRRSSRCSSRCGARSPPTGRRRSNGSRRGTRASLEERAAAGFCRPGVGQDHPERLRRRRSGPGTFSAPAKSQHVLVDERHPISPASMALGRYEWCADLAPTRRGAVVRALCGRRGRSGEEVPSFMLSSARPSRSPR